MTEQSIITLMLLFFGPTMLGGLMLDRLRENQRKRRWQEAEDLRIQREKTVAAEAARKAEELVRTTFAARMNGLGLDRLDELEAFQHSAESKLSLQEQLLVTASKEARAATAEAVSATAHAAQLKSQVERLSAVLESANSTIAELKNTIDRLESNLEANNVLTQAQTVEIQRNRTLIGDLQSRLKEVENERDALRTDNETHLLTIAALQKQVDKLSVELDETKRQLATVAKKQGDTGPLGEPAPGSTSDAPLNVNITNLPAVPKQE